eukprot:GEMP01018699.1.p1 GENE.GEMP01018699.1~~GEMP01018699.1.p1  ORF type:complete len:381 (+),score=99.46 GEMP01018699.1:157-1299(+)
MDSIDVTVRWLTGNESHLGQCQTMCDVRAKVCEVSKYAWPDITLLTPECVVLEDNERAENSAALPLIIAVVHAHGVSQSAQNADSWTRAALRHARYGDAANLFRVRDRMAELQMNFSPVFKNLWEDYWRSTKGHISVIEAMVELGINVNMAVGATDALRVAAQKSGLDIVQSLLRLKANVNHSCGTKSSLHVALDHDRKSIASALLDAGASVNARSHLNETPLHHAVVLGSCSIMQRIIELGADVNVKSKSGTSALHHAVYSVNAVAVQLLVTANAEVDERAIQIADGRDIDVKSYDYNYRPNSREEGDCPQKKCRRALRSSGDKRREMIVKILRDAAPDVYSDQLTDDEKQNRSLVGDADAHNVDSKTIAISSICRDSR